VISIVGTLIVKPKLGGGVGGYFPLLSKCTTVIGRLSSRVAELYGTVMISWLSM
jgi:hypothetical protein